MLDMLQAHLPTLCRNIGKMRPKTTLHKKYKNKGMNEGEFKKYIMNHYDTYKSNDHSKYHGQVKWHICRSL